MLKCFQLLADALNQILTLEQVLVPNFPKQTEAMLKCMSGSKVSHLKAVLSFLPGVSCIVLESICSMCHKTAGMEQSRFCVLVIVCPTCP